MDWIFATLIGYAVFGTLTWVLCWAIHKIYRED